jgi:hypothetical protein
VSGGLLFVLLGLTAYRLTRLIVVDEWPPVARPREAWSARHPGAWTTYLWNCPFCLSVWTSALIVGLTTIWVDLPAPVLWWGGTAGAVSVAYEVLSRLPD